MTEAWLRATHARCAATVLFADGQRVVRLGQGCMPLLVDVTFEDKAAKGLRSLRDAPGGARIAQHFTALEVAADAPLLLLLGEAGAGKTVFARRLAMHLAGEALGDARCNLATLGGPVPRDAAGGALIDEAWRGPAPLPLLAEARIGAALAEIVGASGAAALLDPARAEPLLLILDGAEALGEDGPRLLAEAAALAGHRAGLRVLVLGEAETCGGWALPPGFQRHRLLPLLPAQRAAWRDRCGSTTAEPLPGHPGLLSLALGTTAEPLLDRWLELACDLSRPEQDALDAAALAEQSRGGAALTSALPAALRDRLRGASLDTMLDRAFVAERLAARALAARPDQAAHRFHADPARWQAPLRHLAASGVPLAPLLAGLLDAAGPARSRGAVLAADLVAEAPSAPVPDGLVDALRQALDLQHLPIPARIRAGRHLARLGDPRDLEELVAVPAGIVTMGASTHPNSTPPHRVPVGAFRIGRYPVVNALFRRFVGATGHAWRSTEGRRAERANAPAVDLTWHDARAFCDWVTGEWHRTGRIGMDETARLPTEPEWEYAARGGEPDGGGAMVYPWAGPWAPACCNAEEAGLNDSCAVGLFPAGRSPFGCDDMVGQVWEWCSTNWGSDMATPHFGYPYRADDGREDPAAGAAIRRVLRGGCFSSGAEKATCTYRGSLEPGGFWRGNGLRVVVCPAR